MARTAAGIVPAAPPKEAILAPEAPVMAPDVPRAAPVAPAITGAPPAPLSGNLSRVTTSNCSEVFAGMHKSELARIMRADANRWQYPDKREAL